MIRSALFALAILAICDSASANSQLLGKWSERQGICDGIFASTYTQDKKFHAQFDPEDILDRRQFRGYSELAFRNAGGIFRYKFRRVSEDMGDLIMTTANGQRVEGQVPPIRLYRCPDDQSVQQPAPHTALRPQQETATPTSATEEVAFRGIRLGTTLDQFRRMRHPDQPHLAARRPSCSTDTQMPVRGSIPYVSAVDAKVNIIACVFASFGDEPRAGGLAPTTTPGDMVFGEGDGTATFYFVADAAGTLRLFEVHWSAFSNRYPPVVSAAREAYGEPHVDRIDRFENGVGQPVNGRTLAWMRGKSVLQVKEREGSVDRMAVYLTHVDLSDRAGALRRAAPNRPASRL